MKHLIAKGARLDVRDVYGNTPLHYAVELALLGGAGFSDMYKHLISEDSINIKDKGLLIFLRLNFQL